jgi:hypothetical protein
MQTYFHWKHITFLTQAYHWVTHKVTVYSNVLGNEESGGRNTWGYSVSRMKFGGENCVTACCSFVFQKSNTDCLALIWSPGYEIFFDILLTVHLNIFLSQPVHGTATYRCDDTRECIVQFWPPDEYLCSKHVETWNKLIIKFSAPSWLILR